jgi:hypothetical protein
MIRKSFAFACAALLAACGKNGTPPRVESAPPEETASSLCAGIGKLTPQQGVVCQLYDRYPPNLQDPEKVNWPVTEESKDIARLPDGDFEAFFHPDLEFVRNERPVPLDLVIYEAPVQDISGFALEESSDPDVVVVRFDNFGKTHRLEFRLHEDDGDLRIADIRYRLGHTLKQWLGEEVPPRKGLLDAYLKVRKAWIKNLEYDTEEFEKFRGFSPFRQQAVANDRGQQKRFLDVAIHGLVPTLRDEEFSMAANNNIGICSWGGCHELDGVYFDGPGPLSVLATTETFLELGRKEGLLGEPAEFANALADDGIFIRLGNLPVPVPDSLEKLEAVIGFYGRHDHDRGRPEYLALKAARGGTTWLVVDALERAERIPECEGPGGEDDADATASFLKCYRERLPSQPFYPELVRQAQELANRAARF